MHNLSAVILAAGGGSRIGIPKLKLRLGKDFFVNIISDKLKSEGINDVVCIIRKDDFDWFNENTNSLECIINYNPELGMVSSVKLGVERYLNKDGVLLFPVDHPFVTNGTFKKLISDFGQNINSVIKPYFKGKSGHPLIVPKDLFKYIVSNDDSNSLNDLIMASGISIVHTDVDDEGILKNINYPEDLNGE